MVCSIVWGLGFNPGVCQRHRRPEPVAAQLYEALMRLFKTRARSDDRYFQLEQSIGNWRCGAGHLQKCCFHSNGLQFNAVHLLLHRLGLT